MKKKDKKISISDAVRAAEMLVATTPIGETIDFSRLNTEELSFGKLSAQMIARLDKYIKGRRVFDLGAGSLALSKRLVELGASLVVAVEKEPRDRRPPIDKVILFETNYLAFLNFHLPSLNVTNSDVAFLSWPSSHYMTGLIEILNHFKTVVCLTKTTNETMCGFPKLYERMLWRNLEEHVPAPNNTLLVWGGLLATPRYPVWTELAGIDHEEVYAYRDDLEPVSKEFFEEAERARRKETQRDGKMSRLPGSSL